MVGGPRVARRFWTPEEDAALRRAVDQIGPRHWKSIAEMIPGRNHIQCIQRWKKVLDPSLRKGTWTKEEDESLRQAKATCTSTNWSQIAAAIPGRCGKQCRERWTTFLDPKFKHTAWTEEEDATLLDCHQRVGNQWSLIAKSLPGRSQVRVRDRFKKLCRNGIAVQENKPPRSETGGATAKPASIIKSAATVIKPVDIVRVKPTPFSRFENDTMNQLDLCFVLCGMRNQQSPSEEKIRRVGRADTEACNWLATLARAQVNG
eukprot:g1915.t1